MKINDILNKMIEILKKRWMIVTILSVSIMGVIFVSSYFFLFKGKNESQNKVLSVQVSFSDGSLDPGNSVLVHPLSPSSTEYTQITTISSFVGVPYVIKWRSGINSMARAPVKLLIPIPSQYYLGDNDVNLEAAEMIGSQIQTLYGGEFKKVNNIPYMEVMTYFPGILILRLKSENSGYGLISLNKASTLEPNLVIVPGENTNFSGNVPISPTNSWVQKFGNFNVYLFSYPMTSYRNYSFTSQMTGYFSTSGFDSYTQYMGNMLSNLLATLQGNTYIAAQGVGGLIVRYAVESNPAAGNVKKVVLFDTPDLGTSLASAYTISNFYNAGEDYLNREFQVPRSSIDYILKSAVYYLYSLNFFAKDLSPNSSFLERLNSIKAPSNIIFLSIAGTSAGISVKDLGKLEPYFPELIDGKGDGIVSVKSALAFGNIKLEFPYSFSDIFIHNDVMDLLSKFFNSATSTSLNFKSDNFPQTLNASSTRISTASTRVMTFKYLSEGDYIVKDATEGKFLQKTYSVTVPQAKKMYLLNGGMYLISNDSIHYISIGGQHTVYNGNVRFSNVYNDKFYAITDNWQILEFNGAYPALDGSATPGNYRNIFVKGGEIYTLSNDGTSTLLSENGKILIKIPGTNSFMWYIPSKNVFIITSDLYVSIYDLTSKVGTFFDSISDLMAKSKIDNNSSLFPFNSAYIFNNTLYMLSSNYVLLAIDLKTHDLQVIGRDNIGNESIIPYENDFIVSGDHNLNFYDLINRIRIPVYQKLNSKIIDARSSGNYLYLLTEKGGIYEIEVYVKN